MQDNVPKVEYAQAQAGEYYGDYKEVTPEELGLRIEYGPTSTRPKHNPNKKTNPDWKSTPFRFYDVSISNTGDSTYSIEKLISVASNGTFLKKSEFTGDILRQAWKSNEIRVGKSIFQPDRNAWHSKNNFPITVKDTYILRSQTGNSYKVTFSKEIY